MTEGTTGDVGATATMEGAVDYVGAIAERGTMTERAAIRGIGEGATATNAAGTSEGTAAVAAGTSEGTAAVAARTSEGTAAATTIAARASEGTATATNAARASEGTATASGASNAHVALVLS